MALAAVNAASSMFWMSGSSPVGLSLNSSHTAGESCSGPAAPGSEITLPSKSRTSIVPMGSDMSPSSVTSPPSIRPWSVAVRPIPARVTHDR